MRKNFAAICITVILVCVLAIGLVGFPRSDVSANNEAVIQYKTIKVKKGDTVWGIAEKYYEEPCGDIRDYVYEIKKCNDLDGYQINEGCYLCIPVYTNQY